MVNDTLISRRFLESLSVVLFPLSHITSGKGRWGEVGEGGWGWGGGGKLRQQVCDLLDMKINTYHSAAEKVSVLIVISYFYGYRI